MNQTFSDFRVIVYDDASRDETANVLEQLRREDSRVQYVSRPKNIGYLANFIDGANHVETPFFSFLSDDDVMLPNFFETSLAGFHRHPEAAMSILTSIRMSPVGIAFDAPVLRWPEGLLPPPKGMLSILRYGNPDLPAILFRRDVWQQFGGWDKEVGSPCDMDFELQVSARCPVVVSRQVGGIQLVHNDTITSKSCLEGVWPALPLMAKKLAQDASLPEQVRQEAAETLSRLLKRRLLTRGFMGSMIRGRWEDAEKSANLFLKETEWTRAAGMIRPLRVVFQRLPGTRLVLRALLAVRIYLRVLRRLNLQWQFRPYSKMLRLSPTNTIQSNFEASRGQSSLSSAS